MGDLQAEIDQLVEQYGKEEVLRALAQCQLRDQHPHPETPPMEGRIPIHLRPKSGELWIDSLGDLVTITDVDPYGRSFDYVRTRPEWKDGHIAAAKVHGEISQTDVMDGAAYRVPSLPPETMADLEELTRNFQPAIGELIRALGRKNPRFSILEWSAGSWQMTEVISMSWKSIMKSWRIKMARGRPVYIVRPYTMGEPE